jgi:hypothetical protein
MFTPMATMMSKAIFRMWHCSKLVDAVKMYLPEMSLEIFGRMNPTTEHP